MRMEHRINNRGIMECWNNGMMKGESIIKNHYSTIPLFQSDVLLDILNNVFCGGAWLKDLSNPRLF